MRLDSLLVAPDDASPPNGDGAASADQRVARADGSAGWISVHCARIGNGGAADPSVTIAQFVDTTERHHFEEQLLAMANRDPLTGLMNRRSFEAALDNHIALCKRYGPVGALLALDLDHFKEVNDQYGHLVGDEVIVAAADRLRTRLRDSDLVARTGGDEFVVLLPAATPSEARRVAESLVESIRAETVTDTGVAISLSVSIGVAPFDGDLSSDEMLRNADTAMYEAKHAGRDNWVEASVY